MQKMLKSNKHLFAIVTYGIILFVALQHLHVVRSLLAWIVHLLAPIAYGLCIAFVINLFMNIFRDKVFRRLANAQQSWQRKLCTSLCAISTMFSGIAILAAVIFLIVPQVTSAVNTLFEKMPDSSDQFFELINAKLVEFHAPETFITQINRLNTDWEELFNWATALLDGKIETLLGTAFDATASVISSFSNVLLGFIIAIYVLAQKDRCLYLFRQFIRLIIPAAYQQHTFEILHLTNKSFSSFIIGQTVEAVIIGSLCTIGLTIFQFPYAGAIGILTGITALLPIIGAWIGGAIGVLLIAVDAPERILWFVIFLVVLQFLEGQFIYPKVVGNSLGLPGLVVLLAVILGGSFGGVVGIVFAVPLSAIVYTLFKDAVDHLPNDTKEALVAESIEVDATAQPQSSSTNEKITPPPAKQSTAQRKRPRNSKKRKR